MDENDLPLIYIIGSNMLEEQLRNYVNELSSLINTSAKVLYLNTEEEEGSRISDRYQIAAGSLPAVMIVEPDESVYKDWYGQDLPDTNQIVYEIGQITGSNE